MVKNDKNDSDVLTQKTPDNEIFIPQVDLSGKPLLDEKGNPLSVRFRNTLLGEMFPTTEFETVHLPYVKGGPDSKEGRELVRQAAQTINGKEPDFASGAGKNGSLWISEERVASRFFSTAPEAVAYGSNLVTECDHVQRLGLTALVCRDGEYGTGDCHVRANPRLWDRFGANPDQVMQFRLGYLPDGGQPGLLAKGTALAAHTRVDGRSYDIIVPQSAFKSSEKPETGTHHWSQAVWGAMAFSEERDSRLSYTLTQWFSQEAVRADLLPQGIERATALRLAATDAGAAKSYFLRHYDAQETTVDLMTGEERPMDPALREERHDVFKVLKADTRDLLLHHPHVQGTIGRFLRSKWLELAQSGGERWRSRQAIPDERLQFGQVYLPGYPEGKYLFTRYPIRTKHDLIVVENKRLADYDHVRGAVVMNHATAKILGGDFDGDKMNFAPIGAYPNLAREVEDWNRKRPAQEVQKIKQRNRSDLNSENLSRLVVANMGNQVGIITTSIAAAAAQGRNDVVERLKQPLQDAVDGLKYSTTPDMKLVKESMKGIPYPSWLGGNEDPYTGERTGHLRDERVFREYGLGGPGPGTIAFLATEMNRRFRPAHELSRPLEAFQGLVPEPPEAVKEVSRSLKMDYGQAVHEAFKTNDRAARSRAFEGYANQQEKAAGEMIGREIARVEAESGGLEDDRRAATAWGTRLKLAAGNWHVSHQPVRKEDEEKRVLEGRRPPTGSFGFKMADELVELLQTEQKLDRARIIGIEFNECRDHRFTGETRLVHIRSEAFQGKLWQAGYLIEDGEARKIGFIEKGKLVPDGQYQMSLQNVKKSVMAEFVSRDQYDQVIVPARDETRWDTVRERLIGAGIPDRVVEGLHEGKRLWAAEMTVHGPDKEVLTATALVIPSRHPRTGIQIGALTYAVAYENSQGEVRAVDFEPLAQGKQEAGLLHSAKLRLATGETDSPEKIYVTNRPVEHLRLAATRGQEKASFVLAPETGLSQAVVQWAKSEKTEVVMSYNRQDRSQEAELRKVFGFEAPELKISSLSLERPRAIATQPQMEPAKMIPLPSPDHWREVRIRLVAGAGSRQEIDRIESLHKEGRLYADAEGQAIRLSPAGQLRIQNFATREVSQFSIGAETAQEGISLAKRELEQLRPASLSRDVIEAYRSEKQLHGDRVQPEMVQGREEAGSAQGFGL